MAVPMYFLYEGGLLMAGVLSRMKRPDSEDDQDPEK
jgi:Sec-independent protein secretion pathway component TatC